MTSRERILNKLKLNKLPERPLPDHATISFAPEHLLSAQFVEKITQNGAVVKQYENMEPLYQYLRHSVDIGRTVVNFSPSAGEITDINHLYGTDGIWRTDLVCIEGAFGVADCGAIWVGETSMRNRLSPFTCGELIIILHPSHIVDNLITASCRIDDDLGYGSFIAGPSKTADIEQALVIGAHGAKTLTVCIVDHPLIFWHKFPLIV